MSNNAIGGGSPELPEHRTAFPAYGDTDGGGHEKLTEGFGGTICRVRTPAEPASAFEQALDAAMPNLIDVRVDRHARGKPRKSPA